MTAIGPVVQEVQATFHLGNSSSGPLVATTRVYAITDQERAGLVELEHSIPANIGNDTELVMQISTALASNGSLWTDESGLELHERVHDPTLPISGNYHSLVMSASLRAQPQQQQQQQQHAAGARAQKQLSVLTQHTMGVASLQDGQLEYMMERNIVNGTDDQGPWPLRQMQGAFSFPTWELWGDAADVEKARLDNALRLEHPLVVVHGDPAPSDDDDAIADTTTSSSSSSTTATTTNNSNSNSNKNNNKSARGTVRAGPQHDRRRASTGGADSYRSDDQTAAPQAQAILQPLPDGVHLISFHARQVLDGQNQDYVVRVQNVVEGSGVKTANLAVRSWVPASCVPARVWACAACDSSFECANRKAPLSSRVLLLLLPLSRRLC